MFCPTCGQKNRKSELSLIKWLQEGLSTFFHLEGKSWNTLKDLPVPGKLASNYFNGKRQRYVHPFRLLVFSSLICLAGGVSMVDTGSEEEVEIVDIGPDVRIEEVNFAKGTNADSLSPNIIAHYTRHPIARKLKAIDILRTKIVAHDRFRMLADSIQASGYATASEAYLLDSLRKFYPMPEAWSTGFAQIMGDSLDFDPRTIAYGTPQQVADTEEYDNWGTRLAAQKVVQLYQKGIESAGEYLEASFSWAILIFVPFLAFGYKIFYRRKLPFYTQHLTYTAVLMSVALLLATLRSLLLWVFPGSTVFIPIGIVMYVVYTLLSDRKVFDVSFLHAILKSSLIGFYSLFALMITALIWLLGALIMA